jgi:hypothetical protein
LAIRLNGTSDYDFVEKIEDFIQAKAGQGVKFYDYTKIVPRYKKYTQNKLVHHTFSRSEKNDKAALDILKQGGNVAYVFYQKNNQLPEYYLGYKVINGDMSDLRFLDEDEKEVETKTRNFSDEEPLVVEGNEEEEGGIVLNDFDSETHEEVKNVSTLPSGAISKGKE